MTYVECDLLNAQVRSLQSTHDTSASIYLNQGYFKIAECVNNVCAILAESKEYVGRRLAQRFGAITVNGTLHFVSSIGISLTL